MLKYSRLNENAKAPKQANPKDSGLDLFSVASVDIAPGTTVRVDTGIAIDEFAEGWSGFIMTRSSFAKQSVIVMGGVIDASYRGEIKIFLHNLGKEVFKITSDKAVAQLVFMRVANEPIKLIEIEQSELTKTERADSGFGSTDKRVINNVSSCQMQRL